MERGSRPLPPLTATPEENEKALRSFLERSQTVEGIDLDALQEAHESWESMQPSRQRDQDLRLSD